MNRTQHNTSAMAAPTTEAEIVESDTSVRAPLVLTGRLLFAAIFLASAPMHFRPETIQVAATHGVPFAWVAVPASGVLELAGGLSVLLGYRAKLGAWALVLFLVPVTLTVHAFWGRSDPQEARLQLTMFMKNLSLIGGALLITQFGAGPWSLDERLQTRPVHER